MIRWRGVAGDDARDDDRDPSACRAAVISARRRRVSSSRQSAASAEADGIRACLQRGKPHCWEPVCARATGEAAIRINHYGHAPLTEQNHTYIGAGEKLVDDHWAASLARF